CLLRTRRVSARARRTKPGGICAVTRRSNISIHDYATARPRESVSVTGQTFRVIARRAPRAADCPLSAAVSSDSRKRRVVGTGFHRVDEYAQGATALRWALPAARTAVTPCAYSSTR